MVWMGRDTQDNLIAALLWQGHLSLSQIAPSPVQPALGHSRDPGAATAALGTLCQGPTTLPGKNLLLLNVGRHLMSTTFDTQSKPF